jgi:hypothetical protein
MAVDDYEIEIYTPGGTKQAYIATLTSLDMTMIVNGWGVCTLEFPAVDQRQRFNVLDFGKNYRIVVKRRGEIQGGAPYLIRYRKRDFVGDSQIITLQGFHFNWILNGRQVGYYASSSQAEATTEACDDAMKRLVRDNLGEDAQHSDRDSTREGNNAPDYSGYLAVAANTTEAPTTSRGFARQNLYNVLLDFSADSYAQGTPLFFGFEQAADTGLLTFQTKPRQWGNANGLILSPDYKNLENATQEWDWREEATVGYALGSDTESNRNVKMYVSDEADTVFNWIERTINASSLTNATSLTSEARALVQEHRARETIMGELVQKLGSMYQDNWQWGDRLTLSLEGTSQEVWINKLRITIKNQEETITPNLELVQ